MWRSGRGLVVAHAGLPLVALTALTLACGAPAGNPGTLAAEGRDAPLLEGIGEHTHPITTSETLAQRYFDQGLVMHYAFNNAEAARAFREAQRIDPECAMCYWGEALTLGPGVNGGMEDENVPAAWEALQRASELAPQATAGEQALIEALATRYVAEPVEDRSALDLAHVDAMAEVVAEFPDDSDAATLWAEAKMVSSPWDYWTEEGEPKAGFGDVLGILADVMETDPGNPGANHFYIHAVEAVRPELALGAAERLETLVPIAGHLVHMPAHIYLRLGRYHDATVANERAMEADAAYEEQSSQQGVYPLLYMPHNPHFLVYTAAMEGRGEYALAQARAMAARIEADGHLETGVGTVQHYWVTPLYVLARFGRWSEIMAAPEPPAELVYPRGVWHYVRGLAEARSGDRESAIVELEALRQVREDPEVAEATVWDLNNADDLLQIAAAVLTAEIAASQGGYDSAVDSLQRAIEIEMALTYDEPPPWYQPVRQVLGAVLLEAGRAADAERVYLEDLEQFPENGWSLYGLVRAREAQGDSAGADEARRRFNAAWSRGDVELTGSRF